jgi:1-acyl-sn-glycerol-3-phosphate acyltransferase
MDIWYNSLKGLVGLYRALLMHTEIKGRENIPSGPKIVVGNHAYVSDSFVLPFIFREKLHFAIQAEAFRLHLLGRWLALADQLPVALGQGRDMLRAAQQRLAQGHSIVIFPEGWLNHGLEFHRPGAGAALLAKQTGVPVLPVGFYTPPEYVHLFHGNEFGRQTVGGWQVRGTLYVNIGQPLQVAFENEAQEYQNLRSFTERIMQSVSDLVEELRTR